MSRRRCVEVNWTLALAWFVVAWRDEPDLIVAGRNFDGGRRNGIEEWLIVLDGYKLQWAVVDRDFQYLQRGPLNAFSGEEFREVVVVDFVLVIVVVFGIKEVGVIRIGSNVIGLLKEDTFGEGLLEIESVVVDFVLVIVVVIKEVGVIRIGSNVIGLLKEDTFGEGLLEIERGSGRRQEEEW
ncbi:hypothetical protein LR48_Vigan08g042500 [Vigna angularis]|uniref:Uncharacterized protein n=1 Tax=Phaseolus angularis TaxID=3914 RepID=A0A0L9V3H7_PHAAN|nr:hypothetical protein LR48_Vigan08g042500 [Vigna angularis]